MGKIIVIEGLDGSGKATQTELARKELQKLGYNVVKASFPNYESESSAAVKMYLRGELGSNPSELNPYMCSTFYAVDRVIQFQKELRKVYEQDNTILILDRYISANMIHQGGKFNDDSEMVKFFLWDYEFETKYMNIPKDDLTIVLDVPVEVSQRLMEERYSGDNTKKDIHEANVEYLKSCYHSMEVACNSLTDYNWIRVRCSRDGLSIRSIDDIHTEIMGHIYNVIDKT